MINVTVLCNGVIKLALSGSTEIENLLLKDIFKTPVEVEYKEKYQIGDKIVGETYVISPIKKEPV